MRRRLAADAAQEPEEGGGAPGGSHSFAVSMSHDGGEHWGPITQQPQLVTPVRTPLVPAAALPCSRKLTR